MPANRSSRFIAASEAVVEWSPTEIAVVRLHEFDCDVFTALGAGEAAPCAQGTHVEQRCSRDHDCAHDGAMW